MKMTEMIAPFYTAQELYEVSKIKHERDIDDRETCLRQALFRAAAVGGVELFMERLEEQERERLLANGYDIYTGCYEVGDNCYKWKIYWGKNASGKSMKQ